MEEEGGTNTPEAAQSHWKQVCALQSQAGSAQFPQVSPLLEGSSTTSDFGAPHLNPL